MFVNVVRIVVAVAVYVDYWSMKGYKQNKLIKDEKQDKEEQKKKQIYSFMWNAHTLIHAIYLICMWRVIRLVESKPLIW